jgi:hypothetical protein
MLFYMLKGVMAENQMTLLAKTTRDQLYNLDIQIKGSAPQLRDYDLAFKYGELNGIISQRELLELFRRSKGSD